ncbi:MAG: glycosyltransferase family 4 protein, partial [Anaerolineales bacterium]|nr:glycosyltransferase family 4 protein [Anaerolineales bacterium]
ISFQFDGTRPHNELPAIFQSSDLFVLPSLIEGHPKVLIEAMSCGLPCIVSNSEGNRTLIQHEQNGFLANTQNHSQFAQQIESLLSQPTTAAQLGAAARKHILNRYDIHTLVQEEIALLRQLGEKRRFQVRQM